MTDTLEKLKAVEYLAEVMRDACPERLGHDTAMVLARAVIAEQEKQPASSLAEAIDAMPSAHASGLIYKPDVLALVRQHKYAPKAGMMVQRANLQKRLTDQAAFLGVNLAPQVAFSLAGIALQQPAAKPDGDVERQKYISEMLEKHALPAQYFQEEAEVIDTRWIRIAAGLPVKEG